MKTLIAAAAALMAMIFAPIVAADPAPSGRMCPINCTMVGPATDTGPNGINVRGCTYKFNGQQVCDQKDVRVNLAAGTDPGVAFSGIWGSSGGGGGSE